MFSLDNFSIPLVTVLPEEWLFSDHTSMMADLPLLSPEQAIHHKTFLFFFKKKIDNLYTSAWAQSGLYLSTCCFCHSHECPTVEVKIYPKMSQQWPQIMQTTACTTFHSWKLPLQLHRQRVKIG
jgi:hypothetical protein